MLKKYKKTIYIFKIVWYNIYSLCKYNLKNIEVGEKPGETIKILF